MFDSLRRRENPVASNRLTGLLGGTSTEPTEEEWTDRPTPVARSRLPGRRVSIVVGLVAVVAACAVAGLLLSRPEKEALPVLPTAATTTHERAPTTASTVIVISIVGRVPTPGLVTLTEGARVADAVRVAGGASETDSLGLNMARRLSDGEQLYVGISAPPEVAAVESSTKPAKVNLNTATMSQLDELPGVGEVTAKRIIDWRTEHGRFTAVTQLRQIDGIGDSRFARLKDLVTVS
ncbi:ComEA family DNA-binding protein [Kibdelosporangium lantanae]